MSVIFMKFAGCAVSLL